MNIYRARGFTLIELMVAITIIGILTAGSTIAFSNARARARDAQRYAVLAQMELALETYRQVNNSYPSTGGVWWTVCPAGGSRGVTGASGYVPNLAPVYIAKLPVDPLGCIGSGDFKGYIYISDGQSYKFAGDWMFEKGEKCDQSTDEYFDTGDPLAMRGGRTLGGRYFCSVASTNGQGW